MWSTGTVKKPWIWPAWRSIVTTRSTPATSSVSAMASASAGFERPPTSISRFCGPRSIQGVLSVSGKTGSTVSSPGIVASAILFPLLSDVPFFGDLALTRDREGFRGDIFRDDRSRPNPSIVANLDRRNERIVDAGPDVAADLRAALRLPLLVRIVHGDVSRGDVRVRADLSVADVGLVRHLGPFPDP